MAALDLSGMGATSISLLREGVNLEHVPRPDLGASPLADRRTEIGPTDKLVTYVARDLEPYRGFHVMMRALPHLLGARKDIRVVMVGGDGVSYGATPAQGTWREIMPLSSMAGSSITAGCCSRADRLPRPTGGCCSARTRMST